MWLKGNRVRVPNSPAAVCFRGFGQSLDFVAMSHYESVSRGKTQREKQVRRPADMCVKQAFEVKECWQANGQKAGIGDGL